MILIIYYTVTTQRPTKIVATQSPPPIFQRRLLFAATACVFTLLQNCCSVADFRRLPGPSSMNNNTTNHTIGGGNTCHPANSNMYIIWSSYEKIFQLQSYHLILCEGSYVASGCGGEGTFHNTTRYVNTIFLSVVDCLPVSAWRQAYSQTPFGLCKFIQDCSYHRPFSYHHVVRC